ncbi:MAG TPA: phosphoribosyltransferase family protein [Methanoregula sp.]|nr:phosphoribosyltransferase family protein [Methanoregula sp.]
MGIIIDDSHLRDKRFVFSDRHDAGKKLGALIKSRGLLQEPVVIAIPAGGVPVGVEIARILHAPISLAIVRKIQIPGNTEAGFGAVTWDGHVLINEQLRAILGLSQRDVDTAISATRLNIRDRIARYALVRPIPDLRKECVIVTDDGLASGYTMLAAITSIRTMHPERILAAIPTSSVSSAERIAQEVDEVICLNIRSGQRFAVAEAYRHWYDLDDREVIAELASLGKTNGQPV